MSAAETTQRVLARCQELGFALAGVCDARASDHREAYLAWIASGKHGEMGYLARNVELRLDPTLMLPGAASIICVADRYRGLGELEETEPALHAADIGSQASPRGKIARYARGGDYHKVMRKRLTVLARELTADHPGETFRACVDTAPVLEREHAQRAGLGAVGKNTLLIQRGVGSWLLLGEIITTLRLDASHPAEPDPCGSCTRCIDACPTQAITPWSVDAARCVSYLTIEHRSDIDPSLQPAMGEWIFGCDICQEVCPHNQPTVRTLHAEAHEAYRPRHESLGLLDVLGWDEAARQRAFAGSAMKRARLDMMKRNAEIAMRNAAELSTS